MKNLLNYVRKLEGKGREKRRDILIEILEKERIDFECEFFEIDKVKGMNIVADIGGDLEKKEIILSAHYDKFVNTPGANDNASSIAVLIDLLKKLKKHKPKNKVRVVFFDREEWVIKHIGSESYVKKHGFDNLAAVYNLEMVGMGNLAIIWPVKKTPFFLEFLQKFFPSERSMALDSLRRSLLKFNCPYKEVKHLPVLSSDHMSFRKKGFENAYCLTMVHSEKYPELEKYLEVSPIHFLWNYFYYKILGRHAEQAPLLVRLYHSDGDTSKYLSEKTLDLVSQIIFCAVRNLDKTICKRGKPRG